MRLLIPRGISCQLVSLAELRGFTTPALDLPVRRVIPLQIRRSPKVGAATASPAAAASNWRALARRAVASMLIPLVVRAVRGSRVVVVPNDAAYPYDRLLAALRDRVPVVLMQEGIRFEMPHGDAYGTGGASKICAWGEGSRELLLTRGVPDDRIVVTGSPRHDDLDPATWRPDAEALRARLGIRGRAITFMSNPIEHQGFGTLEGKLALFERFVREAEPVLRDGDVSLIVKNHLFEDPSTFAAIAMRTPAASRVYVEREAPLFAAVAASSAAIVLTSTAGIEALAFGVPLGALAIDGQFVFEYVERGAAVGLAPGAIAQGLTELLDRPQARRVAGDALVDRHLHARGRAASNVADVIAALAR